MYQKLKSVYGLCVLAVRALGKRTMKSRSLLHLHRLWKHQIPNNIIFSIAKSKPLALRNWFCWHNRLILHLTFVSRKEGRQHVEWERTPNTAIPVSWRVEEAAVLQVCQPTRGSVMWMVVPWEPGGRRHPLDNWSDPTALEKRESWNKKCGLLTLRGVRMAKYRPIVFACLWTKTETRSTNIP